MAGPLTGARLPVFPSVLTTWKRWKTLHPGSLVLSTDTGFSRPYGKDPYQGYRESPFSWFGARVKSPHLPEKELVLGVELGGERKAYPFSVLREMDAPFEDRVAGETLTVHFDRASEEAFVTMAGRRFPATVSYWFVWHSFHPDTEIFRAP